jgi:predicted ATPase/DNA-binding SARP family transcriptional activator
LGICGAVWICEDNRLARSEPTKWRIELLGGLRVSKGDKSVARFETRRAAVLLARLAHYLRRAHPREELIEMLWPDEDIEVSRLRFRQVLTTLRRSLESVAPGAETILIADRSTVQLDADATIVDTVIFEEAVKSAAQADSSERRSHAYAQAVELYVGELLPGFYEDWVLQERQRLADIYLAALLGLSSALRELGDYAAAVVHVEKAIATDPLREDSHCELMSLYAELGRTPDALKRYRELEQLLWKEFRILPAAATQSLAESLRKRTEQRADPPPIEPRAAVPSSSQVSPMPEPSVELEGITLPVPRSRFFGRESEIEQIVAMLPARGMPSSPLVTLSGPGGTGKTRLVIEVARRLQQEYGDAVRFVPLDSVTKAQDVATAIADVVCPDSRGQQEPILQIVRQLGRRPSLLILDNFEQVAEGGALVVSSLLERIPDLRCLITSRSLLRIDGEQEFYVAPLPVPTDVSALADRQHSNGLSCASVQLFLDRVQKGRPGFELTETNSKAIIELCRRLEGIPLAIELAAAWASALSPEQMLERLSRRFELLVSNRKGGQLRHQSLLTTIEWSYDQLTAEQQQLFLNLSVFRGGWSLEAAEAVAGTISSESGAKPPDATPVIELLEELRSHSLVLSENVGNEMRFRMLETLREFANEALENDSARELRRRHAHYFMELAERARSELYGPDQIRWLDRLHTDLDNFRDVLAWSTSAEGEIEVGLRIAVAIYHYWNIRVNPRESKEWVDILLPRVSESPPLLQARVWEAAAFLATQPATYDLALSRAANSLDIYRSIENTAGIARVLFLEGFIRGFRGETELGHKLLTESVALLESLNDNHTLGQALGSLGTTARIAKKHAEAIPYLERAVAIHRISGNKMGMAWCLFALARTIFEQGDYAAALPLFSDSLALNRQLNNRRFIIDTLYNIGDIHQAAGDLDRAEAACEEALRTARTMGDAEREAIHLTWSGDLACQRRDFARARAYYRQALSVTQQAPNRGAYNLLFRRIACVAAATDDLPRAVRMLAAAGSCEQSDFANPPSSLPYAIPIEHDQLRAAVGEAEFDTGWSLGAKMTLEQAASYALSDGS